MSWGLYSFFEESSTRVHLIGSGVPLQIIKRPDLLNLSGSCCSSNYSVSTHALQNRAPWPLQLILYLVTSFVVLLSRAVGLSHVRKMQPSPIFCLLRTELRMTAEVFFFTSSSMLDSLTWKRTSKFINGILVFVHRFIYDNILSTTSTTLRNR